MNTLNNNFKDPTWGWARTRPDPTWDCNRQSSLLPRPKRQVALGSAPRIGVTQAPGGAQVCPSATWHMGHSKEPDYLRSEAGPDCLGCGVIYPAQ